MIKHCSRVLALYIVCLALLVTTTHQTSTVPVTTDPATTVPATTVPATTVPATTVPATTVPATTVPATTAGPTAAVTTAGPTAAITTAAITTAAPTVPVTTAAPTVPVTTAAPTAAVTTAAPTAPVTTAGPTAAITTAAITTVPGTTEKIQESSTTSNGAVSVDVSTETSTHKASEGTTEEPTDSPTHEWTGKTDHSVSESTDVSEHSTDSGHTDASTSRQNYCPQVFPECSCLTSPIVMKCDNFDRFSQLDFKKLINKDDEPYSVYELELSPKKPVMLDAELDLTGISKTFLSQVILRNINGFDYFANPFEDIKAVNDDLRLFIYDSFIQFYLTGSPTKAAVPVTGVHCDLRLVEDQEEFHPIFSSFDFVSFSASVTYPDKVCPLAFRNAEIRLMQFYSLKTAASLVFDQLNANSKAVTSLNSKVTNLNILETVDLALTAHFLDKDVFERLYQLNIESTTMKSIHVDTFKSINSLRRVILFLDNLAQFIRSTPDNPWMANLNGNIRVNLENATEVAANKDKQMIITFNDRSKGQKYDWPDRDVRYFVNFPHDKLVFPRVLANVDIDKCTLSLGWLYLYRELIENQADINTTSSFNCLLGEPITTQPISTSPTTPKTTTEQVTKPPVDSKLKFTNTQFYVTLGVLLGAVVVLFLLVIMLCTKYKKLKSESAQVGDSYSLRRF